MPTNESKSFQTFKDRIHNLRQHLQVIDASLKKTSQWLGSYTPKTVAIATALGVSSQNYNYLNKPISSHNSMIKYTKKKMLNLPS
ncbi:hypothetical protein [Aureispira anguillae]|uniref:Uncharacterized protein n=1 Tax=Aureispira anguillae TaxID=2864201 RepID=A0A915YEE4_9BACT|nr:hypothetical protein [Aureispira anguillae]BDS11476.1 hypothetical protein AsAng_0021900 [Aureispira anguillae]